MKSKVYRFCERVLFPVLLFLYPLRHICFGVEWADTGYNYANFIYLDNMDPMWKFSTYLANAVGNLLTRLPFGDRMIGLNFYTGLAVSILALSGYFFFTNKIKLPSLLVFLGEVIAVSLCWCPTALLYNYLTYLLMLAAVLCLYEALTTEKGYWFVIAGICLGINVFVRFSNLAQAAFILAVWAYAVIRKKKFRETAGWTGWCALGYVLGLGGIFGYICIRYGAAEYVESVCRLFDMSSEASSYTVMSMIESQIRNYIQNLIWLGWMLLFVLIGVIGFAVLPKHLVRTKKVGFVCCMGLVFYWLRNQNMYNFNYHTIMSVFQWAVCLLTFNLLIGLHTIFRKKASDQEKLLCGLAILTALLTPLGSNNHLYASINNLFFGAPVILWMLWKVMREIPALKILKCKGMELYFYTYPFKATVTMIVAMLFVTGLLFGATFVFIESDGGENFDTKVENSDILKGMYTDEEHGAVLEDLLSYVQDNKLTGQEILLYGNIPALSYYLEMPYAISPWPDLPSYNYDVMKKDLESIREKISAGGRKPVILLEASYGTYLIEGGELPEDRKFRLLAEFAEEFDYKLGFDNDKFMLFRAAD